MKEVIKKFVPPFVLNYYHLAMPFIGNLWYGVPSKKLKVIGVTGTNGKSTVANLIAGILEEAGFKIASLSSIKFKIGDKEWENTLKMTMPGRLKIQKFLSEAVKAGCQYAVIEVSSEGIKQHRHRFIDFDEAVITNLTAEHIESHGSFAKYKEAKGQLFKALSDSILKKRGRPGEAKKISVVNLDSPHADYFLDFPAEEKYGFKIATPKIKKTPHFEKKTKIVKAGTFLQDRQGDFQVLTAEVVSGSENIAAANIKNHPEVKVIEASNVVLYSDGIKFLVNGTDFNLKLLGKFNVQNALGAIAVGLSQGIDLQTMKRALERVEKVPGRMEILAVKPFTVIVDYAHTPDALEEVYCTVRNQLINNNEQKIRCILGAAGGGRDKWKRPEMGKIAAKYCDQVILTNEDPYDEDPEQILSEIESGIIEGGKQGILSKILDRKEAIREVLASARPGDVVLITGKGSEPWMMLKQKKISWDDREIVKETLKDVCHINLPTIVA